MVAKDFETEHISPLSSKETMMRQHGFEYMAGNVCIYFCISLYSNVKHAAFQFNQKYLLAYGPMSTKFFWNYLVTVVEPKIWSLANESIFGFMHMPPSEARYLATVLFC